MLPEKELNELHEVQQMLAERVDVWIQRGVQQGVYLGQVNGEYYLAKRLVEKKFGALTVQQQAYLEGLDENGLFELGDKLLDAQELEDIFP